MLSRSLQSALLLVFVTCADDHATVALMHSGALEVVGVSGHRLAAERAYRVPLDSTRPVPVGRCTREALAVVNFGARPVWIQPIGLEVEVGRWRLLEPTYAAQVPLSMAPMELGPGAKRDLDVAVCPLGRGVQRAWLGLAWYRGRAVGSRWMLIEATAAAPADTSGPDPPTSSH